MKIDIYNPLSIHEIGQRDNQEDSLWPLKPSLDDQLFILCDGMGGHEHGEVASQTVCQALGEWYHTKANHPLNREQIEDAIAYAYTQLDKKDSSEVKKMGTTLTLLYIGKEGVIAAHMGDSRIYHIRPMGGVLYQSRDHSLAFDLFQAGEITYEEMCNFDQKNIITRAMTPGVDNRMRPDIISITDVQPDDYFYLCSDGMLEQMSNDKLISLLSSNRTDEEKQKLLIAATVDNQDNHSAWLIHIKNVIWEKDDDLLVNEEPTARCNAVNFMPRPILEDDVKVVDDDDVLVISTPKQTIGKKYILLIIAAAVMLVLVVLISISILIFHNDDKEKKDYIQRYPMTHISLPHSNDLSDEKSSVIEDTMEIITLEEEKTAQ